MKIRTKILLVFLPSIVSALAFITGLISWQLHNDAVKSYETLSSSQLNQTSNYIQLFWKNVEENIIFLADLPETRLASQSFQNHCQTTAPTLNSRTMFDRSGQRLFDLWQIMQKTHSEYNQIYCGYLNGNFASSLEKNFPAGFDPRKRIWFIEGMKYPDKRVTKSPAFLSVTNDFVVAISAKIYDKSEIIGFTSFDINLTSLVHLINSLHYGKTGRYLLLEKTGRILANTADKDTVFKTVQELNNPELLQLATGPDGLIQTTMHGKKVYANVLTAYNDYKLIAIADSKEVLAEMRKALTEIIFISILLLIVLICITWFLARSIGKPLNLLSKTSDKVAHGDYNAMPDLSLFSGELHSLAKSMNRMVMEIKNKIGFSEGSQKAIPIPAAVIGSNFKMEWCNQDMLDLHGITASQEEIVGWQAGTFFFNDENKRTLSHDAIEQKKRLSKEISYTNRNGEPKVILITTSPFYDLDGELLGAFSFWMDLTEIRLQQRRIEEQNKRIAATAKDSFSVADQMAGAAEELSAQVEQSSRGTDIQRERVSETVTSMEEMNSTVLEVARNASGAAEVADNAKEKAEEGQIIVKNTMQAIKQVESQSLALKDNMEQLGHQAEEIGTVMNVIADIADQTNLLALNAAIEAARAGEYGRGFAVVADEVRKLAEKTMTATKEVGTAIENIQTGTRGAVKNMEDSVASVEEATKLSESSERALEEIVHLIESASDQVRSIATASEEQSASSEEINMAIGEINRISTETAEAMEQSAQAVADLAQLAQELNRLISDLQNA